MAWLHTWTGLVTGWVLFFVFVTGTAGYMTDEITRWMQPERPMAAGVVQARQARHLDLALAQLESVGPGAKSWTITLPHIGQAPRGERGLSIAWEDMPTRGQNFGRRNSENLDPQTGEIAAQVEPRATGGGFRLYRMHYVLHYMSSETAIKLVGICSMLMLLAVVTGVITHKKIFTDFFTFRPGKGQRSWLDAHNVVSVMSLPFFLMITYTGLLFFVFTYMPAGRDVIYGGSPAQNQAYFDTLFARGKQFEPVTRPAAALPDIVQQAEADWGKGMVASLQVIHPQDGALYVDVRKIGRDSLSSSGADIKRFSAADGTELPRVSDTNATVGVHNAMLGLHEGVFATWWLRWLYFISGLLGCAVIGTGLVMWTVKRRTQHQQRVKKADTDSFTARLDAGGLRLVEILNVGTLVGLPLGVAAYFWANRLLPVNMAERAAWEVHVMFFVWGWALLFASIRPLKRAWVELLYATIAAYALIPILNAVTTDKHLGASLPQGDWGLAGFDLTMFALAAAFAYIARKLRRKWQVVEVAVKPKSPAPAVAPAAAVTDTAVAGARS